MLRTIWGVSFLAVLGFAAPSLAQPMVPGGGLQRPTVSPYINLVRGSGGISNAALNYYGIVRPEQQFRAQATQMQQQLSMTNQNLNALASNDPTQQSQSITGKGATFQYYSHYFGYIGGTGGGIGGPRSAGSFGGFGGGMSSMNMGTMSGVGSSGRTIQPPAPSGARRR